MSNTPNIRTQRIATAMTLGSLRMHDGQRWVAWWYGGLKKNYRASSQPLVVVVFRKLSPDGRSFGDYELRSVPLTALGQMRLGTIWTNNRCREKIVFQTREFLVDYRESGWQYNSFAQASQTNREPPYPRPLHPLPYERDKNPVIELSLETSGKLVIPSLEFFSRCYGRSQELKRVLATYPWRDFDDPHGDLYAALDQPEVSGQWVVALKGSWKLVVGDAKILAFAKYLPHTRKCLKSIYAQLEQAHAVSLRQGQGSQLAHPKIGPWFKQPARLRVRGIPFNNGKSFLALEIIGSSEPEGPPITLIWDPREAPMRDDTALPTEERLGRQAYRTSLKGDMDLPLTKDDEPDRSGPCAIIDDPEFKELLPPSGKRQHVISQRSKREPTGSPIAPADQATDAEIFSSGAPHGEGKGVGLALFHAPVEMESQGKVRDMWEAAQHLQHVFPERIQSVGWFTSEGGFRETRHPKLIQIAPIALSEKVSHSTRKWPFLDKEATRPRGALVMRIQIDERDLYIVEIQRRTRAKADGSGEFSEESMSGLCFHLDSEADLEEWLRILLSRIRYTEGVFKGLVGSCPGDADTFVHSKSKNDTVPCEAATRNALRKMGVKL